MKSAGSAASTTIAVAYSIGPRTSSVARLMTASADSPLALARASRNRRTMLSTSSTASSTITATASIRPAMIIMSIFSPLR